MLPDAYPSAAHLPFNAACLQGRFTPAPPDADPGGEGFWFVMRGTELLTLPDESTPALPEGASPPVPAVAPAFYFGLWQGRPCRALPLPREAELPEGMTLANLLAAEPRLPIELLTLAAMAGQLLHWERGSRHCARCGNPMESLPAERGKRCPACGHLSYPHIHPCVIVLVRRGDEARLTRKREWAPGRYSLVAGFLDFGECFEEAVAREVLEETGVTVENVRYLGSQAWPFPSQVMAGFVADYVSGEVVVEEKELEDARWFRRDALPALPPRRSIARWIIDRWLAGEV